MKRIFPAVKFRPQTPPIDKTQKTYFSLSLPSPTRALVYESAAICTLRSGRIIASHSSRSLARHAPFFIFQNLWNSWENYKWIHNLFCKFYNNTFKFFLNQIVLYFNKIVFIPDLLDPNNLYELYPCYTVHNKTSNFVYTTTVNFFLYI